MPGARERTLVVCAAFDADLEAGLGRLQGSLRQAGVRVPHPPRHRPHLTLLGGACPEPETARVLDAVAGAAAETAPVEVVLDRAGTFRGGAVLWAGPGDTAALARWHGDAVAAVERHGVVNELGTARPGRWAPHCTLARRVRDVPAAVRTVEAGLPLAGRVVALVVLEVGGAGDLLSVALRH
ncbi:2'-5' RNA ligase [Kineococcus xinjiangensis]|uniref:2'-5' RNA ligase n=1 Tax=Kineococcus xinjiangensis TaxID=512762 RepID=A0A2S6IWF2_9ACTN|nr:2'-5' RNA ligase family protein [Kineococcus xinjiangensis]PPK98615.1 2'-5' RNA ligase [Kineococcus xinjiangensis]